MPSTRNSYFFNLGKKRGREEDKKILKRINEEHQRRLKQLNEQLKQQAENYIMKLNIKL
jgi:hypothetical protein